MLELIVLAVVAFGCFFVRGRRRHRRFDCDWSSDVCSSDLFHQRRNRRHGAGRQGRSAERVKGDHDDYVGDDHDANQHDGQLGRSYRHDYADDDKGAGTIGIGSVSTGAVTITPALTPAGGIASPVALTKVAKATGYHTCEQPAFASTVGTDTSNTNTEAYIGAVTIPGNVSSTGASVLNGSAVAGNVKYYLFNSDGTAALAATASTAQSGTDAYQRIAWVGGPIALVGPATYYIAWTGDTTGETQKINQINFGEGPAWKETALTYGTLATITPVTTFTADRAPFATLY